MGWGFGIAGSVFSFHEPIRPTRHMPTRPSPSPPVMVKRPMMESCARVPSSETAAPPTDSSTEIRSPSTVTVFRGSLFSSWDRRRPESVPFSAA